MKPRPTRRQVRDALRSFDEEYMSTAQEIALKALMAAPRIKAMTSHFEAMSKDLFIYGTSLAIGREVCARRASKLRKRGEDVFYIGRTKTGKSRYRWMRRITPWSIYKGKHENTPDTPAS